MPDREALTRGSTRHELRGYLANRPDWHAFAYLCPDLAQTSAGGAYWDGEQVAEWLDKYPDGAVVTITVDVPPSLAADDG